MGNGGREDVLGCKDYLFLSYYIFCVIVFTRAFWAFEWRVGA